MKTKYLLFITLCFCKYDNTREQYTHNSLPSSLNISDSLIILQNSVYKHMKSNYKELQMQLRQKLLLDSRNELVARLTNNTTNNVIQTLEHDLYKSTFAPVKMGNTLPSKSMETSTLGIFSLFLDKKKLSAVMLDRTAKAIERASKTLREKLDSISSQKHLFVQQLLKDKLYTCELITLRGKEVCANRQGLHFNDGCNDAICKDNEAVKVTHIDCEIASHRDKNGWSYCLKQYLSLRAKIQASKQWRFNECISPHMTCPQFSYFGVGGHDDKKSYYNGCTNCTCVSEYQAECETSEKCLKFFGTRKEFENECKHRLAIKHA